MFNTETYNFISTTLALLATGGWFVYYRANKKKANGEAVQSEAEGWRKQQEVYQETIENQKNWYDHLKADFNIVVEENTKLRTENNELREKVYGLETMVFDLKREISRLGRRVEALSEKSSKKNKATE